MTTVKTNKKLIEVALPLDAINKASAREKSIRHGHPSTLHLWWARRPLAAARAVIFAQMVDDPSVYVDTLLGEPATKRAAQRELKKRLELWEKRKAAFDAAKGDASVPEPGKKPTLEDVAADVERERLFKIIEELVKWENTTKEEVLQKAREEIWQSWRRTCALNADHPRAKELFDRHKLPAFHDPFAGGGSLPLEAQRLGLEAYASDLNPVAVLINKAMIEIPPKFAGRPPVNPEARAKRDLVGRQWKGAEGLAEDVRYYGKWMRDQAEKRIGHLYPKVEVTAAMAKDRLDLKPLVGHSLTINAWIWARTVRSPNPAFADVAVPLASTFWLSTKKGSEAYVAPLVERDQFRFVVKIGRPTRAEETDSGTKLGRGAHFRCLMSDSPIASEYVKAEGQAGRMGARLLAAVCESEHGRIYLSPSAAMETVAAQARPKWRPEGDVPARLTGGTCVPYGLRQWGDLFTPRQLVALTTFADLVREARDLVVADALASNSDEGAIVTRHGERATAYGDAVAIYLALASDRLADRNSSLCGWDLAQAARGREATVRNVFARQALPMVWDFAEVNILSETAGSFDSAVRAVVRVIERLTPTPQGHAAQQDATTQSLEAHIVSTDPPYFDNISYADLSDFFYVWLRRALQPILPEIFSTLAVPKAEELVATSYRHGSKEKAESFFLQGMTDAMSRLARQTHPDFPVSVYYAFKQSESDGDSGSASTGWDTFLGAVIRAGLSISGTWPIRTELSNRMVGAGANVLASSIVLICRPRDPRAGTASRREFASVLKEELPSALAHLQRSNIAPVDLAQAAIGPGMAVYTRYAKVLSAEGVPLTVRDALTLINEVLGEVLAKQEGDFDADTRWALTWFEQSGFADGEYGMAEQLSKSKNTSVTGMVEAGILHSSQRKVRLLKPSELPNDWDPADDTRLTVWEMVHHLIRLLETDGEGAAGQLAAKLGAKAEVARELAYLLYTICERKKRASEALSYNALVQSWPEITRIARDAAAAGTHAPPQADMFA